MKKIVQISSLILGFLIAGCSKEVDVDLNVKGAETYSMLYMPQANGNPVVKSLSISESVYKFNYSAFLGGSLDNGSTINVKFGVVRSMVDSFNLKNGTDYKMMPEGSYTLDNSEVKIASGSKSTGALNLSIKTLGFILPFQSYLLPVSIIDADAKVNSALNTTYFLVTGSYAPGEVPREKAYALGADAGGMFFDFNGDMIGKSPGGNLLLYPAGSNGTFNAPRQIGAGWDIFNTVFYYGGDRLIGRYGSGGGDIAQYKVDGNGNFGASRTIGFGWGIFAKIIPFKGLLLGIDGAGNMNMYPLDAAGDFDFGRIKTIGTGWGGFIHVFPYENSLLAIDASGDMFQFPLSDEGVFGTKNKVGSGWDMYTLVFPAGKDLLALDGSGDLWRYKFNPVGFWPLKK
ncbi:BT_3987 domain-containing protein [Pedobacter steynii]|uniref:DUF1735 domain-containing protein n=1 Tax=Pedobacter steynii TaxID=430522 RepID=A0A1D7QL47_9SPHI|nr:DUF1735 domain-containing protein [Pedobacter steynii]AOM79398.1 hypothetical protein BFS30_20840 [Pedobacter steynii]